MEWCQRLNAMQFESFCKWIFRSQNLFTRWTFRKIPYTYTMHNETDSSPLDFKFNFVFVFFVFIHFIHFILIDEYSSLTDKFHSEFMKRTNNSTGIVWPFHFILLNIRKKRADKQMQPLRDHHNVKIFSPHKQTLRLWHSQNYNERCLPYIDIFECD